MQLLIHCRFIKFHQMSLKDKEPFLMWIKHFTEIVTPERVQFDHRIGWGTKTFALFKDVFVFMKKSNVVYEWKLNPRCRKPGVSFLWTFPRHTHAFWNSGTSQHKFDLSSILSTKMTQNVGLHGCITDINKDEYLTPATNPGRNSFQEGAEFLVWNRTTARSPLTPTLFLDP